MLALIKREIEDNRVFFIAAIILAVIFSVLFVYQQYNRERYGDMVVSFGIMISILMTAGLCALGAAQMYSDKTKKVSALLATLAVSRNQIFTARVITGVLLLLIGLVPFAGTIFAVIPKIVVELKLEPSTPIRSGLYAEILVPVLLLGFACYCIGLQAGWTSNKIMPSLGALGLCIILISVIVIKGFDWEIYAILISLIAACLIRAWFKFSRSAL